MPIEIYHSAIVWQFAGVHGVDYFVKFYLKIAGKTYEIETLAHKNFLVEPSIFYN